MKKRSAIRRKTAERASTHSATDKATVQEENEKPQIRIAAHVVIQLGQELVSDTEQAFLELAKNAYDADSASCEITIEPDWEISVSDKEYALLAEEFKSPKVAATAKARLPVGRVLIRDTGVGAPPDAVRKGWLTISASLKRPHAGKKHVTAKGRTPVGDKGLGRLATMKIGDLLQFRTYVKGEKLERITSFSWGQFSHVRTIDEITVTQRTVLRQKPFVAGSCVEVIGLHDREQWKRDDRVPRLVARLSSLVNPFVGFKGFDIRLIYDRKSYSLQKIGSEVLNFAAAKFEFEWDGSELTKKAWIGKTLFRGTTGDDAKEKFERIFADENLPKLKEWLTASKRFANRGLKLGATRSGWLLGCNEGDDFQFSSKASTKDNPGAFQAEVHYFLYNEEFSNKIQGNAISAEQVKQMAGILVFRDGFRVRMGDDWLGISEGTTSGGFYSLRPKNTLGYFALSNKANPNLVEKSDREGFVDNRAFQGFMQLAEECKKYANEILNSVRDEVAAFNRSLLVESDEITTPRQARSQLKERGRRAKADMKNVQEVALRALKRVDRLKAARTDPAEFKSELAVLTQSFTEIGSSLGDIQEHVAQIDRTSEAVDSFRRDEAQRNLRLLESAAVGLTARTLAHEFLSYIGQLDRAVKSIARKNIKLKDSEITASLNILSDVIRELRKVIVSIDPLLPGARSVKESLSLGPVVADFVAARQQLAQSTGVTVKVTGGDVTSKFRFSRTRFFQILENLFQNSLYWLQDLKSGDARARLSINISIRENGFDWFDSGPGVVARYENTLFDAFISSKPKSEGQGLGLYIVSTFLESERCSIELLPTKNENDRRFKFRVDLSSALLQS